MQLHYHANTNWNKWVVIFNVYRASIMHITITGALFSQFSFHLGFVFCCVVFGIFILLPSHRYTWISSIHLLIQTNLCHRILAKKKKKSPNQKERMARKDAHKWVDAIQINNNDVTIVNIIITVTKIVYHIKYLKRYDFFICFVTFYPQAPLYSVRWYFESEEFYRYVPKESPPSIVFPVSGITVDVSITCPFLCTFSFTSSLRFHLSLVHTHTHTRSPHEFHIIWLLQTTRRKWKLM